MVGIKEVCALLLAGGIGAGSVVTVQEAVPSARKASAAKAGKPGGHAPARHHAAARPSALNDCPSQLGVLGKDMVLPPLSPIDLAPGLPIGETAMGAPSGGGGSGGIPGFGGAALPPGSGGGGLIPGIPESDTWAMMIAGFGLIGLALRRSGRTLRRH